MTLVTAEHRYINGVEIPSQIWLNTKNALVNEQIAIAQNARNMFGLKQIHLCRRVAEEYQPMLWGVGHVFSIGRHRFPQKSRILQCPRQIDQSVDSPIGKQGPKDADRSDRHALRRRRYKDQGRRAQPTREEFGWDWSHDYYLD
jgi:hypothetical protein